MNKTKANDNCTVLQIYMKKKLKKRTTVAQFTQRHEENGGEKGKTMVCSHATHSASLSSLCNVPKGHGQSQHTVKNQFTRTCE